MIIMMIKFLLFSRMMLTMMMMIMMGIMTIMMILFSFFNGTMILLFLYSFFKLDQDYERNQQLSDTVPGSSSFHLPKLGPGICRWIEEKHLQDKQDITPSVK